MQYWEWHKNQNIMQGEYDLFAITLYLTIFFIYIIVLIGVWKIELFIKKQKKTKQMHHPGRYGNGLLGFSRIFM